METEYEARSKASGEKSAEAIVGADMSYVKHGGLTKLGRAEPCKVDSKC